MIDSSDPGPKDIGNTVIVIVTYGRRLSLLQRTIAGLDASPHVARLILVDNGSAEPVTIDQLITPHPVTIIRIDGNAGSAGGFALGIASALELDDVTYLAILDDDNLAQPGYLEALIALHHEHGSSDDVAFAALRSDRPHYLNLLQNPGLSEQHPNAFLGFHLADVPMRLLRRLMSPSPAKAKQASLRAIHAAPYGGLFLPIATARRIGAPRADFVLYGDDHEYTRRLVQSGVTLYLTDVACIEDIDQSWNLAPSKGSLWVDQNAPAWRIYYAARNHVFLERSEQGANGFMHALNGRVFTARLLAEALLKYRSLSKARTVLGPFRDALADARVRKLGSRADYPIPGWKESPKISKTSFPVKPIGA